ncbi:MAG: hypothetical protein DRI34_02470 [Deltaproteobacteria bacterium]|nr:MAG: hypothetical protein DRI34_02470 [Deltaproteobacteria bacterium]
MKDVRKDGPPWRLYCRSLGCRVNLADLATMIAGLDTRHFVITDNLARADAALLNTCTVTHRADRDVRKILGSWQRRRPELPVILSGCAVKNSADRLSGFANVKAMLAAGTGAGDDLATILSRLLGHEPAAAGAPDEEANSAYRRLGRSRAYLKIQDGCNARCSYCIVSRLRGPERSLSPRQVITGVQRLFAAGHGEVVLCGIHLGRYGRQQGTTLAQLLRDLDDVCRHQDRPARLRLSSIEPGEWTDELIEVIQDSEHICRHFHVPMQSGDDEVLRTMARPYRADQVERVLAGLRQAFPTACLGSDLLVGFPGEGDAAFARTRQLASRVGLDRWHVFPFSVRPGTPAAEFPGQLPDRTVRARVAELRRLGQAAWQAFLQRAPGRTLRVLLEKNTGDWLQGLSGEYLPVRVPTAPGLAPGTLVMTRALAADNGVVSARLLEKVA